MLKASYRKLFSDIQGSINKEIPSHWKILQNAWVGERKKRVREVKYMVTGKLDFGECTMQYMNGVL